VVFGGGNALGYQLAGLGYDRFGAVGPVFAVAAAIEALLLAAVILVRPWEQQPVLARRGK
jgi:hypothetical protein